MKTKQCPIEDRHDTMESERCIMCDKKVGLSFKEKLKIQVDKVPKKTKQKFIDLLHEGKTIGEAEKKSGITDTLVAGEIIMQNIGEIHYLKKQV